MIKGLERAFREVRRCADVMGCFLNESTARPGKWQARALVMMFWVLEEECLK